MLARGSGTVGAQGTRRYGWRPTRPAPEVRSPRPSSGSAVPRRYPDTPRPSGGPEAPVPRNRAPEPINQVTHFFEMLTI